MNNLHALLIGIDAYLPNRLQEGFFPTLTSCVHDTLRIEEYLREHQGLTSARITRLTASRSGSDGSDSLSEPAERWPTYANIVKAFGATTDLAQPGDHIFIHYSGHAILTRTIYPERKGVNAFDQALVPVDIGSSLNYLRDVEVAYLLKKMGDKGLRVTLVIDSCHAGGEIRRTRKSARNKKEPVPGSSAFANLVAPRQILLRSLRKSNFVAQNPWLPEFPGHVLLAASSATGTAFEYPFEGIGPSGVFTHCFLEALKSLTASISYKELFSRILSLIQSLEFPQKPMLFGDVYGKVFEVGVVAGASESDQALKADSLPAQIELILEVAFRLVIAHHVSPDLLVHFDPAKLRSAAETLLRQGSSVSAPFPQNWLSAARDLLASQQPGIDPNPLWLAWMTTVQSKLLEPFASPFAPIPIVS